jgi:hypothetical protein
VGDRVACGLAAIQAGLNAAALYDSAQTAPAGGQNIGALLERNPQRTSTWRLI